MEERYIGNAKMFTEKEKQILLPKYQAGHDYTNITDPFMQKQRIIIL